MSNTNCTAPPLAPVYAIQIGTRFSALHDAAIPLYVPRSKAEPTTNTPKTWVNRKLAEGVKDRRWPEAEVVELELRVVSVEKGGAS